MAKPKYEDTQPFKPAYEDTHAIPVPDTPVAQSAAENVADAITSMPSPGSFIPVVGGVADYVGAAGDTLAENVYNLTHGKTGASEGEIYGKNLQAQRNKEQSYAEEHPVANTAISLAGAGALPVGGSLMAAAPKAGILAKAGVGAVNAGGRVALNTGATYLDALTRGGSEEQAEQNAQDSGKISAVLEALGAAGHLAGKIVGPAIFGVRNETSAKYLARRPEINAANESHLVEEAGDVVGNLKDNVSNAKSVLQEAKSNKIVAERDFKEGLKTTLPPEEMAQQIIDAKTGLKKEISQKSGQAFDILENNGRTIPKADLQSFIDGKIKDLEISGQPPPGVERQGYDKLKQYHDFLNGMPEDANPADIKRIVQAMDSELSSVYQNARNGAHVTQGDRYLADTRKFFDDNLKQDPLYAKAMEPVAALTRLHGKLDNEFYDIASSNRALKNLAKPEYAEARQALGDLGAKNEVDYIRKLNEYEKSQGVLKSPKLMDDSLAALPENEAYNQAAQNLQGSEENLGILKNADSTKLTSAIRGASSDRVSAKKAQDLLQYLSDKSGKNFVQAAEDVGVNRALNQGFQRGSRNVNLGAISFAGLMSKLLKNGESNAGTLAAIGALLGAGADVVGPKTYKVLLDVSATPQYKALSGAIKGISKAAPQAIGVNSNIQAEERSR